MTPLVRRRRMPPGRCSMNSSTRPGRMPRARLRRAPTSRRDLGRHDRCRSGIGAIGGRPARRCARAPCRYARRGSTFLVAANRPNTWGTGCGGSAPSRRCGTNIHVTHSPVTHRPSTNRQHDSSVRGVRDRERQSEQRRAFGERLRRLRTARELTQEQLAHASDLDRTYVGAVENGRRNLSLHAMWQLADALHVSPEAFFCRELEVEVSTTAES